MPDSGWIVTDGVTVVIGVDADFAGSGRRLLIVLVTLSLWDRADVLGLRGEADGSTRSSDVEMGSSCSSSPLKSVMIPLSAECQPDSEDSLERGSGVVEEVAAITRFRSTSLTLMLRRLFLP